jgi:hypothetical protein
MASTKIVTASVVREWAKGTDLTQIEGLPENYQIGTRGRLHPAVRAAFDKAHKGVRYEVGHKEAKTVKVTAIKTTDKGRKVPVTKNVNISEARKAAKAAGLPVGERGMPNKAILLGFVRGDFGQ